MKRRHFTAVVVSGLLATKGVSRTAIPSDLHIFIPANAGGGWDRTGRALGAALVQSGLVSRVTYENYGGGAGTVGWIHFSTRYAGHPRAVMVMGSVLLGGILTNRPPLEADELVPLARLTEEYNIFVLPPQSPWRNMREVLQQFRADPASIKWGGGSRGSTEHIVVHLIARALGVPGRAINYIPFRGGGEAAAAVMAGYVSVGGSGLSEFGPHIRAGRMRAVAITAPQRQPLWADVPTLYELGVAVDMSNWRGLCAAPQLSDTELTALRVLIEAGLATPAWQEALHRHGWHAAALTGPALEVFVASEFDRVRRVLTQSGLLP